VGGWPRISTAVAALRARAAAEGAGFFFLDAGDEFTGTLWDVVYRGQSVLPQLMNRVKPDLMVSRCQWCAHSQIVCVCVCVCVCLVCRRVKHGGNSGRGG
jgi:hypothetical protein